MSLRYIIIFGIFSLVLLGIDLYAYKGIRLITEDLKSSWSQISRISFWLFNFGVYFFFLWVALNTDKIRHPDYSNIFFLFNGVLLMSLLSKVVFILFHGMEDIIYGVASLVKQFMSSGNDIAPEANQISRGKFLSYMGAGLAAIPLGAFAYGMIRGRFDFRVIRKQLGFNNLPQAFEGWKVVQISDLHIGSFPKGHTSIAKAVQMINQLEADIIVFTGDFVNNLAVETDGWIEILSELKAKHGKYAILGNHDYGDYIQWPNREAKIQNLEGVKQAYRNIGFDLLLNDGRKIEKDGEHFAILGVENWGKPPFPQLGDVTKAQGNLQDAPFKILLSHDPSHWDGEIISQWKDIDLTLSGHTHGMQFGIEIPGFKWSPVKYKYPRWAGLYQEGKQFLYVNRGLGYHAYAGRVGIMPEITEITLTSNV